MFQLIALYDKVACKFSYPLTVESNLPLIERELRNQISSGQSYELVTNYKDKVCVFLGSYDLESGHILVPDEGCPAQAFGMVIPYNQALKCYPLFELKDLFVEEDKKSE